MYFCTLGHLSSYDCYPSSIVFLSIVSKTFAMYSYITSRIRRPLSLSLYIYIYDNTPSASILEMCMGMETICIPSHWNGSDSDYIYIYIYISASWYRPVHHLGLCALPMLRCSSFFAYTPNWPVALFLLLLHPPRTLYTC